MLNKTEFSARTLFVIAGFILSLWFLYQIRNIITSLFVSVIIVSAVHPLVDRLAYIRIPRSLAILLVYLIVLAILFSAGGLIVPPLLDQSLRLLSKFPEYVEQLVLQLNIDTQLINPSMLRDQIAPLSGNLVRLSVGIFNDFVSLITLIVFTFYLLLERQYLERHLARLISGKKRERIYSLVQNIEQRLGAWVRGELALMTIIGILSYIGLRLLNMDFALPLAILAGLLEILPVIGPILSAVPAILIALTISPVLGLAVAALYFLVQQLENHLIVPKVMQKAVGLHPLITILALMVGGKLMGIVGALLAVPVLVVAQTILFNILNERHASL